MELYLKDNAVAGAVTNATDEYVDMNVRAPVKVAMKAWMELMNNNNM